MPTPLLPRTDARPRSRVAGPVLASVVGHALVVALLLWLGVEEEPREPSQAPSFEVAFEPSTPQASALSVPGPPDPAPAPAGDDTPPDARPPAPATPPPAAPEPPAPEPPTPEPTPEPAPEPPPLPPPPTPPTPTPPTPPAPEPPPPAPAPPPPPEPAPAPEPAPQPQQQSRLESHDPILQAPHIPDLDLRPPPPPVAPPPRPRPPAPPRQQFTLNSPGAFDLSSRPAAGGAARPRGSNRYLDLRLGQTPDAPPDARATPANLFGQVNVHGLGPDWANSLRAWVAKHAFYPEQARQAGEDGTAVVHFEVDRDGRVSNLQITSRSGSLWLDMSTLGVFRNATVPRPPPGGPERAEVEFTINYILVRQ